MVPESGIAPWVTKFLEDSPTEAWNLPASLEEATDINTDMEEPIGHATLTLNRKEHPIAAISFV